MRAPSPQRTYEEPEVALRLLVFPRVLRQVLEVMQPRMQKQWPLPCLDFAVPEARSQSLGQWHQSGLAGKLRAPLGSICQLVMLRRRVSLQLAGLPWARCRLQSHQAWEALHWPMPSEAGDRAQAGLSFPAHALLQAVLPQALPSLCQTPSTQPLKAMPACVPLGGRPLQRKLPSSLQTMPSAGQSHQETSEASARWPRRAGCAVKVAASPNSLEAGQPLQALPSQSHRPAWQWFLCARQRPLQ